jgi:hypothetical protein
MPRQSMIQAFRAYINWWRSIQYVHSVLILFAVALFFFVVVIRIGIFRHRKTKHIHNITVPRQLVVAARNIPRTSSSLHKPWQDCSPLLQATCRTVTKLYTTVARSTGRGGIDRNQRSSVGKKVPPHAGSLERERESRCIHKIFGASKFHLHRRQYAWRTFNVLLLCVRGELQSFPRVRRLNSLLLTKPSSSCEWALG